MTHHSEAKRSAPPLISVAIQLFAEEKTEPATPRRREEARKEGQVARTTELGTALLLMAGFACLYMLVPWMARQILMFARETWSETIVAFTSPTERQIVELFVRMTMITLVSVGPLAGLALVVGLASQLAQVGFFVTGEPMKPQLKRLNPISGLKRMLSKRAVVEFLKSSLKVTVIGIIVYTQIRNELPAFTHFSEVAPGDAAALTGTLVYRAALWVGGALLVMAAFDYAYQRWEHEQSIKMTKREARDEARQMEGDPQVRSKIRQRQRQIAMMRMMAEVPRADVVITNPTHLAVALQYDPNDTEAPMVAAKGAGPLAARIKEIAEEHGIAVLRRPDLARTLYETVSVGGRIPEALYQAVAEVLAFVYRLRRN